MARKRSKAPTTSGGSGAGSGSPTRTEVRSPTSTSTEAETTGNITVTGGAGAGATTSVTISGRQKGLAGSRGQPYIKGLMQTIRSSAADAEKALARGDCGEASADLAHAYQLFGEAEGYARAMREMKGRVGGGASVLLDKRMPMLGRIKNKIRRACSR